ncbi:MAG: hypothetical protein AAGN46_15845, partial [Acidobacteriota bacterium]
MSTSTPASAPLETDRDPLRALGVELPDLVRLSAGDLPPGARALLAHDRDMTSTLEAHHGESIDLRPIVHRQVGSVLEREVVLVGRRTSRAFEYGAIRIHLDAFERPAIDDILAGEQPLGALLAIHQVDYSSAPFGFFGVGSTPRIDSALGLQAP